MRHFHNRILILTSAAILTAVTASASVGTCGHPYCFGAISAGDGGMTAHTKGHRTAPDAVARVEKICGTRCDTIEVFHSGCAAISENFDRQRVAGFGETREMAEAEALDLCAQSDGRFCRIRVAACSK